MPRVLLALGTAGTFAERGTKRGSRYSEGSGVLVRGPEGVATRARAMQIRQEMSWFKSPTVFLSQAQHLPASFRFLLHQLQLLTAAAPRSLSHFRVCDIWGLPCLVPGRCSHLKPWGILGTGGSRALLHDRLDTLTLGQTKTTCFLLICMQLSLESLFQRNPHKPFITQALLMQKVDLVVTPLIVSLFFYVLSTHGLQNTMASGFPSAPLADPSQVSGRSLLLLLEDSRPSPLFSFLL